VENLTAAAPTSVWLERGNHKILFMTADDLNSIS